MCFIRARHAHNRLAHGCLGEATNVFIPYQGITCGQCGKANLEVFYTSTTSGRHLCPDCFESRQKRRPPWNTGPASKG